MKFELKTVSREFFDTEIKKKQLDFKLNPVLREQYNNEINIAIKKRGGRYRQQKFDELEIAYYKRRGIEI